MKSAAELLFGQKSASLSEAFRSLPSAIEDNMQGQRFIHSPDNFVQVTEGRASHKSRGVFTVVTMGANEGAASPAKSVISNSQFESLSYTRYTIPSGSNLTLEENFQINPDGSMGQRKSMILIDYDKRSAREIRQTPDWARANAAPQNTFSRFVNTLSGKQNKEKRPSQILDLNQKLTTEQSKESEELKTSVQELSQLVSTFDGTHNDSDGKKDGRVKLFGHRSKAGLPLSEPMTAKVRRSGLGVLLGKKTVSNPYEWLISSGEMRYNTSTGEAQELDIRRKVGRAALAPSVPELEPEDSETRFTLSTQGENKVYEARNSGGQVRRLIEGANGTLSYVDMMKQESTLHHYDLPSFQDRAKVSQANNDGKKAAYLDQHAKVASLPVQERGLAWIDLCFQGEVDASYVLDRLSELPLAPDRARRIRMTKRAGAKMSSAKQLATYRGALAGLKQHSTNTLTISQVGDNARKIITDSHRESPENRQAFLAAGFEMVSKLASSEGDNAIKIGLPYPPRSDSDQDRYYGELLALGRESEPNSHQG